MNRNQAFQDYDIVKMDFQQFSDVPLKGSLKMFRIERREYKFNVTFKVTSDNLIDYYVEGQLYRSAIGNNQFILTPVHIPQKPMCDCLSNEYRDYYMDDIGKHSNLPINHDKKINYCDLLRKVNLILSYTLHVRSEYQIWYFEISES